MDIGRRDLLKVVSTSGLIAAGLVASEELIQPVFAQNKPTQAQIKRGEMLYRILGRTGEQVSVIGLGGHHIGRECLMLRPKIISASIPYRCL